MRKAILSLWLLVLCFVPDVFCGDDPSLETNQARVCAMSAHQHSTEPANDVVDVVQSISAATHPFNEAAILELLRDHRLRTKAFLCLVGGGFVFVAAGDGVALWNPEASPAPLYLTGSCLTFAGSSLLTLNHCFLCQDEHPERSAFLQFVRERAHFGLSFLTGSATLFGLGVARFCDPTISPYVINGISAAAFFAILQGYLGFGGYSGCPLPSLYKCFVSACYPGDDQSQTLGQIAIANMPPSSDIGLVGHKIGVIGISACLAARLINIITYNTLSTLVYGTYLNFLGMLTIIDAIATYIFEWAPVSFFISLLVGYCETT